MLRVPVRWQLAAPAIVLSLVVISLSIGYRALSARDEAATEADASKQISVTFRALDSHASTPGDLILAAAGFRSATEFRGGIYLCSPDALFGYDSAGTLIETWRVGRELPAGALTAIASGASELFITTNGAGILVFDGSRFRQLLPGDSRILNFTSVLALNAGRVLFGTAGQGVLSWDGKSLRNLLPELKSAYITAIAGSDADLWIGTLADGAWRLHAGQLDRVTSVLPDPHVLSLAVTGTGSYVGTALGVVEFRDGKKARTLADGYFARSLDADSETLAVGTEDEGIITVALAASARPRNAQPDRYVGAPVERIFRMGGERDALAGGLLKFDRLRTNWTGVLEPAKGTLTDRNIAALNLGRDGKLWVGYFDRGLDVVSGSSQKVEHFENDNVFCVNRIVEDPNGSRTAVATANGLVMFDGSLTVRQVLGRRDGLLADHITDVLFRPAGMVVATPAGLSLADASGVRSLYVLQGLVNNHVYTIAAADDRIAAGTLGGLSLLEKDVVTTNYTTGNSGLKHNWISALARVGNDWFAGTYGAGVMRLDQAGQWTSFPDMKLGIEVNPNALAQTADALYAGSLGRGLWVYSKASGRWRVVTAGLPSLNVTALATGNGFVYAGTDNGLVRFREGELK